MDADTYVTFTNEICRLGKQQIGLMLKWLMNRYAEKLESQLEDLSNKDSRRAGSKFVGKFCSEVHSYKQIDTYTVDSYNEARAQVDEIYQKYLAKIEAAIDESKKQKNNRQKIEQYVAERENAIEGLALKNKNIKDWHKCVWCHVEVFRRKLALTKQGGCVDYDAPFEDVKKRVDAEYKLIERQILEAIDNR